MLIFIIKNIMQNFLCLHLAQHVFSPKHICNFFIDLIIFCEFWHNYKLLQGIIKMFLIVMEWRIFYFLYFFLFVGQTISFLSLSTYKWTVILIIVLPKGLWGLGKWFFLDQVKELRDVLNRISSFQASLLHRINLLWYGLHVAGTYFI